MEVVHSDQKLIRQLMAKNHYRVLKNLGTDLIFVKEKVPTTAKSKNKKPVR